MKRPWTNAELTKLRREYPDRQTRPIARELSRSESSVYQRAVKLGLRKSASYLASPEAHRLNGVIGGAHRFAKGHATWNKGASWTAGGKSAETRFRKGSRPQTWRPIGSERVDADGILWRKVSDTGDKKADWKAAHVLAWESVNGPLPVGKVVIFADGNRRNLDPGNLLALTRPELMHRNSCHTRYPKEICQLIQLRGAVNRQIRKRERNAE